MIFLSKSPHIPRSSVTEHAHDLIHDFIHDFVHENSCVFLPQVCFPPSSPSKQKHSVNLGLVMIVVECVICCFRNVIVITTSRIRMCYIYRDGLLKRYNHALCGGIIINSN